jgi:hypothetical protein
MATKHDNPDAQADKASAEVQEKMDDALEKGYIGVVPDPNPNLAYSPLTGPDSPPLVETTSPDSLSRTRL